jgi:hypothetical protein
VRFGAFECELLFRPVVLDDVVDGRSAFLNRIGAKQAIVCLGILYGPVDKLRVLRGKGELVFRRATDIYSRRSCSLPVPTDETKSWKSRVTGTLETDRDNDPPRLCTAFRPNSPGDVGASRIERRGRRRLKTTMARAAFAGAIKLGRDAGSRIPTEQ